MKVAVVLLTFIVCALAIPHHDGTDDDHDCEEKKESKRYRKECAKETGITKEISKQLLKGDFSVRDEKAQCFVKCFFNKTGFMNEVGEPQADVILEKLKKKKVDTDDPEGLVKDCVSRKGGNDCETAFMIYECYRVHVTDNHEDRKDEEKTPEEIEDEKERKENKRYRKECAKEIGITKEISKQLLRGDFSVRDENAQCFVKCFFNKTGFMNEVGEPQSDVILEKLKKRQVDTDNLEGLVKDCVSRKGQNDCETAFMIYECYRVHVTDNPEDKKDEEKTPEEIEDEKERKESKRYRKECAKETGITKEISKQLLRGDFSVRDEKAQCYVKCFFNKTGFMNEVGEPQSHVILEKLKNKKVDTDDLEGLVKDCVTRKGGNDCETAFMIYECYRVHVTDNPEDKKDEEKTPEERKPEEKENEKIEVEKPE